MQLHILRLIHKHKSSKKCPDEEGIETYDPCWHFLNRAKEVRRSALTKKGLKLLFPPKDAIAIATFEEVP